MQKCELPLSLNSSFIYLISLYLCQYIYIIFIYIIAIVLIIIIGKLLHSVFFFLYSASYSIYIYVLIICILIPTLFLISSLLDNVTVDASPMNASFLSIYFVVCFRFIYYASIKLLLLLHNND